ncbi:MAG: hypothetical protein R3C49_00650 [Planctomycetaceae bacterium]
MKPADSDAKPQIPGDSAWMIKCGGSLLQLPDVASRLQSLLLRFHLRPAVVLVGGGECADLVRRWDQRFSLSVQSAHDLAITAMSLNAGLLCALQPQFQLVHSCSESASHSSDVISVLEPVSAIRRAEPIAGKLPCGWDITSDSIAAWLARAHGFSKVLLLKSVDLPDQEPTEQPSMKSRLQRLADQQLTDQQFPRIVGSEQQVWWSNLAADSPTITPVLPTLPPR